MASMRERVREQGGELRVHSTKSGTLLRAVLPCAPQEAKCPSGSLS
jgi:signal transduction histidine kinase